MVIDGNFRLLKFDEFEVIFYLYNFQLYTNTCCDFFRSLTLFNNFEIKLFI